ncbi:hypothetical protein V5O48_016541 [Marasmius crinis-equi]|uniref:Uncharacterized protein n=1 Tax=Marasmius crinis-equi TaxID=585013 RepID=A0ABR3ERQ1_9AGAR
MTGKYSNAAGIRIGDVGVIHDERPFSTLFNLIEPENDAPNDRIGVLIGFEPLLELKERLQSYTRGDETITQPKGSVSERADVPLRTRHFELKSTSGALLALPQGSCLHFLGAHRARFEACIRRNFRQWFAFAEEHEGENSGRTLCLVTDVEKCSAWAMATWGRAFVGSGPPPGPTELVLPEANGRVGWCSPKTDCYTSCHSNSLARGFWNQLLRFCGWDIPQDDYYYPCNQDVFVRGYWINRRDGGFSSEPPDHQSPQTEHKDCDAGGGNSPGDPNDRNPFRNRHNTSNSSATGSSGTYTNTHGTNLYSLHSPVSASQTITVSSDHLSLGSDIMMDHPCKVINKFALALLEIIDQNTSSTAFWITQNAIAFSHDQDWMSLRDKILASDDGNKETSMSELAFILQIANHFKFVARYGRFSIYTA